MSRVHTIALLAVVVVVAAVALLVPIPTSAAILSSSPRSMASTSRTGSIAPFTTSAHVAGISTMLHSAKRSVWQGVPAALQRAYGGRMPTPQTPSASPDWKACAACVAPVSVHVVNASIAAVNQMCINTTNPDIQNLCGMVQQFGPLWLSYAAAHLVPSFDAYLYCAGMAQCTQLPVDLPSILPYMPDSASEFYTQINIVWDIVSPSLVGMSELLPALPNDTYVDPDGSFPYPYVFAKEPTTVTSPAAVVAAAAGSERVDAPYETCLDCVFDYTEQVEAHYDARWEKVCAATANGTVVGQACAFCAQHKQEATDYCSSVVYAAVVPVQISEGYCVGTTACQWNGGLSGNSAAKVSAKATAKAVPAGPCTVSA